MYESIKTPKRDGRLIGGGGEEEKGRTPVLSLAYYIIKSAVAVGRWQTAVIKLNGPTALYSWIRHLAGDIWHGRTSTVFVSGIKMITSRDNAGIGGFTAGRFRFGPASVYTFNERDVQNV